MQTILLLLKLCGIWLLSWIIGCIAHAIFCFATAKDFIFQGINHGNNAPSCAIETAVFSFVIIMPMFPVLYLPVLFGLRWLLGGVKPKILFLFVSTFLYLIPLGRVYYLNFPDRWFEVLFSSDEFHVVLLVTSLLFGLGFVWLLSKPKMQETF